MILEIDFNSDEGIYGIETGRLCEAGPEERCCYSHRLQ